jgi:diguanylate cyclase (GGDEF)-like protein
MHPLGSSQQFIDPLTGFHNREFLRNFLTHCCNGPKGLRPPWSLIALDLDHFRDVNSRLLLPGGDRVLVEIAQLLSSILRSGDFVVRDGGDQFTIILPRTGAEEAFREAERIRLAVSSAMWGVTMWSPRWEGVVTVSIGVATLTTEESDAWRLFEHARNAVHCAKSLGRNRVQMAGDAQDEKKEALT